MSDDALMLSGNRDIGSSGTEFISTAYKEKYLSPDRQIDTTVRYNEMDFRRIQNGEKKQPDYIVVFRKNGQIPNMEKAKIASEQFKEQTGKALPIVIVDEDKCMQTEERLMNNMIEEFEKNPTKEQAKMILQKVRNNRVANEGFADNIDLSEIEKVSEKSKEKSTVTMEECKQCYDEIEPEERSRYVTTFKMLYQEINQIKEKEEQQHYGQGE